MCLCCIIVSRVVTALVRKSKTIAYFAYLEAIHCYHGNKKRCVVSKRAVLLARTMKHYHIHFPILNHLVLQRFIAIMNGIMLNVFIQQSNEVLQKL